MTRRRIAILRLLVTALLALPAAAAAQVPVVTIQATDPSASEVGAATGTFTFTRTGDTSASLQVTYTVGGTATNNGDYAFIQAAVTFSAGSATATRLITPDNDALVEGNETVVLTLQDGPAYDVGAPASATVTIADNPTPVITVAATDSSLSEAGPNAGAFTFTRVGDPTFQLMITYVIGGTATNNGDYAFIPTTINIPAGETSAVRVITPDNDALVEGDETVVLTIQDGLHYDVGVPGTASVAIVDQPTPVITVQATDPGASEVGPGAGAFTFTRAGDTAFQLTVNYTIGGTATNNGDYAFIPTTISFPAGEATVVRTITPDNDALVEGNESVILTLNDGLHYDVGAPGMATVTIADNATPIITIQATDPNASEAGPGPGAFTFTRVGDVTFQLTVTYGIGGTATNNGDYAFIPTTITFPAGETTAVRTITPINDPTVEGAETVVLALSDGAHYDLGGATLATVTIADNVTPVVTVEATDPSASETGPATGTFTFTRVGDLTFGLPVTVTIGGTATNNGDYAFVSTTINFQPGVATATQLITPNADASAEGPETVVLTLQDGANYDVGAQNSATVTIADGAPPTTTTTTSTSTTSTTSTSTSSTTSTSTTSTSTTAQTSSSTSSSTSTTSSTSSSSSTTTSTTVTTTSSSTVTTAPLPLPTTTTVPPVGCAGTPDGPSFASIGCRLEDLLAAVNAEGGLGSYGPKLAQNLSKAIERTDDASAACEAADTKKARSRLAQVKKALGQYAHRLKGRTARRRLDGLLREGFLSASDAIVPDVTTLRSGLACM